MHSLGSWVPHGYGPYTCSGPTASRNTWSEARLFLLQGGAQGSHGGCCESLTHGCHASRRPSSACCSCRPPFREQDYASSRQPTSFSEATPQEQEGAHEPSCRSYNTGSLHLNESATPHGHTSVSLLERLLWVPCTFSLWRSSKLITQFSGCQGQSLLSCACIKR